jgi:hypothetical protein
MVHVLFCTWGLRGEMSRTNSPGGKTKGCRELLCTGSGYALILFAT